MSIPVECPVCLSQHSVNERLAGREVRCPTCDEVVAVPALTPDPIVEPDAIREDDPIVAESVPVAAEVDEVSDVATAVPVEPLPLESAARGGVAASSVASHSPASLEAGLQASRVSTLNVDDDDDLDDYYLDDEEFAAAFRRPKHEDEELDMTPMVDVTFLLLIFFMVTASFSLQKSIEMPRQTTDLPSVSNTDQIIDELDVVELEINEFGAFRVLGPDNETETPGKQNLINTLKDILAVNGAGMKLTIKVHELAKLQALVDGMDAGAIAGYNEIKVTQVDGFD